MWIDAGDECSGAARSRLDCHIEEILWLKVEGREYANVVTRYHGAWLHRGMTSVRAAELSQHTNAHPIAIPTAPEQP
jgi:hypothetical protein